MPATSAMKLTEIEPTPSLMDSVRAIVRQDLAPIVGEIDRDGVYPEGRHSKARRRWRL